MQITYASNGTVQLKTKTETVLLGNDTVTIGDKVLSGPGEYDVASILCEAQALPLAIAYFVRSEELLITYLTNADQAASQLDDASDTAILVLEVRSDADPAAAKAIIKALEPAYLFLIGAGATSEFRNGLGIPLAEESSLKVTASGLPLEGTMLIPA